MQQFLIDKMDIAELHKIFIDANGISTDTRNLVQGSIFFALKGETFNGNEFAAKALAEGCSHAVVDEEEYAHLSGCILVSNVLKTLQDLANFHRKQFNIPVLGITGSNGKTTCKELIGAVLSKKYNPLVTIGNLNNHLGVPFTLLRITSKHDFAIIEMGASKKGDIKELAEIAEPTHGIITNIGMAHIEGFGSFEGVIETKTELYHFISNQKGTLFVNADDELLMRKMPQAINYQYGSKGKVQGKLHELTPFVNFSWKTENYESPILVSHLVGRYNFTNFLAAAAIGTFFEVAPEDINDALSSYLPSNNRSQVTQTDRNTLIVDCYNANVTSMQAALESFVEVEHNNKLVILGDMLELGDISEVEHQKVVSFLEKENLNAILVGKEFSKVTGRYSTHSNVAEVIANENLADKKDLLVLLKGSRGLKLEGLISEL